jgi:hypothetical protein
VSKEYDTKQLKEIRQKCKDMCAQPWNGTSNLLVPDLSHRRLIDPQSQPMGQRTAAPAAARCGRSSGCPAAIPRYHPRAVEPVFGVDPRNEKIRSLLSAFVNECEAEALLPRR